MDQHFSPPKLAFIFHARGIQPDKKFIAADGRDYGYVAAWELIDRKYLIIYGDNSKTYNAVVHADYANNLAWWLDYYEPIYTFTPSSKRPTRVGLSTSTKLNPTRIQKTLFISSRLAITLDPLARFIKASLSRRTKGTSASLSPTRTLAGGSKTWRIKATSLPQMRPSRRLTPS